MLYAVISVAASIIADITVAASEGMVIHLFLNFIPPAMPAIPMIIKIV